MEEIVAVHESLRSDKLRKRRVSVDYTRQTLIMRVTTMTPEQSPARRSVIDHVNCRLTRARFGFDSHTGWRKRVIGVIAIE